MSFLVLDGVTPDRGQGCSLVKCHGMMGLVCAHWKIEKMRRRFDLGGGECLYEGLRRRTAEVLFVVMGTNMGIMPMAVTVEMY